MPNHLPFECSFLCSLCRQQWDEMERQNKLCVQHFTFSSYGKNYGYLLVFITLLDCTDKATWILVLHLFIVWTIRLDIMLFSGWLHWEPLFWIIITGGLAHPFTAVFVFGLILSFDFSRSSWPYIYVYCHLFIYFEHPSNTLFKCL